MLSAIVWGFLLLLLLFLVFFFGCVYLFFFSCQKKALPLAQIESGFYRVSENHAQQVQVALLFD